MKILVLIGLLLLSGCVGYVGPGPGPYGGYYNPGYHYWYHNDPYYVPHRTTYWWR